jgi:segregation and condensation protein B
MITKRGLVEGLIFASTHAVSKKTMMEILEVPAEELETILEEIRIDFERDDHGFVLASIAGGFQFRTRSELKEVMAKFYEKKPPRLTQATLEVLSVIAYKQPITRPEIEKIRGVDCTGILKTLLERELIEMRGRSDLPGHPVVYGTTPKFLEWFQINQLSDLPPLSEMEALNQARGEVNENLLQFMTRDDGFQAESLTDVDETLKAANRADPVFEFSDGEQTAPGTPVLEN